MYIRYVGIWYIPIFIWYFYFSASNGEDIAGVSTVFQLDFENQSPDDFLGLTAYLLEINHKLVSYQRTHPSMITKWDCFWYYFLKDTKDLLLN